MVCLHNIEIVYCSCLLNVECIECLGCFVSVCDMLYVPVWICLSLYCWVVWDMWGFFFTYGRSLVNEVQICLLSFQSYLCAWESENLAIFVNFRRNFIEFVSRKMLIRKRWTKCYVFVAWRIIFSCNFRVCLCQYLMVYLWCLTSPSEILRNLISQTCIVYRFLVITDCF